MKKNNLIISLFVIIVFIQCIEKREYKSIQEYTIPITENTEPKRLNPHNTEVDSSKPFYQGTVLEVIDAGGYTYLKISEQLENHVHDSNHEHKDFWIVVGKIPVNIGDKVRFQKELVTINYTSKTLNRTFDELMFASNIQRKLNDGEQSKITKNPQNTHDTQE